MKNNRICKMLGIEKPIVQGPMLWVTSPELVVAVCDAGGLGTVGINCGYNTMVTSVEETKERCRAAIKEVKSKTDKPFAFNYVSIPKPVGDAIEFDDFSEATLEVAIEEGVNIVVCIGEIVEEKFKQFKDLGMILIYRDMTPTIERLKLAEQYGADIIVASSFDMGGHAPQNGIGTISMVPIVKDTVNVPVMASGGIVDKRQVDACFALGADGVFCGTIFMAVEESPLHQKAKNKIIISESFDTVFFNSNPGMERSINTEIAVRKHEQFMGQNPVETVDTQKKTGIIETFLLGKLDEGTMTVCNGISLIKEIKSCKEVIDSFFPEKII